MSDPRRPDDDDWLDYGRLAPPIGYALIGMMMIAAIFVAVIRWLV